MNKAYEDMVKFYRSVKIHIAKTEKNLSIEKSRYEMSLKNPDSYPITSKSIYLNILDLTSKLNRLESSEEKIKEKLKAC